MLSPSLLAVTGDREPGELLWGAPSWIVPAAVIVAVLAILVVWNYSHRVTVGSVRLLAGVLKMAAILLLAVCLLQPLRSGTRPRAHANVLPVLIDNSQSMRLKPAGSDQARGDRIAELFGDDESWWVRLAQTFDVRNYSFDARLEAIDDPVELPLDGYVSSLTGSLQNLAERFVERPVGGVLLFTDGNMTDAPPADFDWSQLGFPIYAVLPEQEEEVRDLRIAGVSTTQTDFESAPLTVRVAVDAVAMGKTEAVVQIRDATNNQVIEEKSIAVDASGKAKEVRFQFRPDSSGVQFYSVNVFRESDRQAMEQINRSGQRPGDASGEQGRQRGTESVPSDATDLSNDSDEATLVNNRRLVAVNRAIGPYRVLYVAGRPNWEFKFIRRALQEDAEVQLVGLLRIANKEPKFSFRDRGVNETNPLFAGLGADAEDAAAQYDEPVILRLGVKESEELSDGFPESAEELFGYHGVILDDIDPEFFSPDQLLLLRQFVATRGGGLLMLGGQEMFADKRFADTPLGELAPFYSAAGATRGRSGAFQLEFTREGMLQPWIRLRDNEAAERNRIAEMPSFTTLNSIGDAKPGASTLATVQTDDGQTSPALVAHRFGKGRSAAIPLGDLWRWSMHRNDRNRDDPAQAWRQITHWLVNEVPKRVEVRVESGQDPSQPVTIIASARDESYLPLDNANVELEITPIGGKPFPVVARPDDRNAGEYQATYWSRQPGGYRVTAKVTAGDGSPVGTATAGWSAQSDAAEFRDLQLNRKLLETMTKQSGGEIVREDRLEQFANDLPDKKVPVTEAWVYPIWHHPWVMMTAMLFLCCEWGLRRWKGLA
ncbi:glutamine amidotransferase [Allorhodopirellula solitaria]|nr:glutamine amidotransferase [Allorhodopirellula solitaria]